MTDAQAYYGVYASVIARIRTHLSTHPLPPSAVRARENVDPQHGDDILAVLWAMDISLDETEDEVQKKLDAVIGKAV